MISTVSGQISGVEYVLEANWNAVQIAERLPLAANLVQGLRLGQCVFTIQVRPGADTRFSGVDGVQTFRHQLFGVKIARLD